MKLIALIVIILVAVLMASCSNMHSLSHLVTFDMSGAIGIQSVTIVNSENGAVAAKLINPQDHFCATLQSGIFFLVVESKHSSYCTQDISICGEYYILITIDDPFSPL